MGTRESALWNKWLKIGTERWIGFNRQRGILYEHSMHTKGGTKIV